MPPTFLPQCGLWVHTGLMEWWPLTGLAAFDKIDLHNIHTTVLHELNFLILHSKQHAPGTWHNDSFKHINNIKWHCIIYVRRKK